MASVQPKWIFKVIQAFAGRLIAAIDYPTIRREQGCGPEVSIAVPPIAGAAGRTAGAQDARGGAVDLFLVFLGLEPLGVRRRRRVSLQPRFDRGVLSIEMREVRDQILDDGHVRQRIDPDVAL